MRCVAVIEVSDGVATGDETELIREAFNASYLGRVALVCSRATYPAIDRILDPVVDVKARALHGVVYVDRDADPDELAEWCRGATVVATTREFQDGLAEAGIPTLTQECAMRRLESIIRNAAVASGRAFPHSPQ